RPSVHRVLRRRLAGHRRGPRVAQRLPAQAVPGGRPGGLRLRPAGDDEMSRTGRNGPIMRILSTALVAAPAVAAVAAALLPAPMRAQPTGSAAAFQRGACRVR